LDRAIAEFRDRGVVAIGSLGGDGTLHRLVDAVVRGYPEAEPPVLLPLAGGTMNGLPRAFGTGHRPDAVLAAALAALASGQPRVARHHVLRVEVRSEQRVRYGFSMAAGVVYRIFQEYYRTPEPGMADALRASLLPIRVALFGGPLFDGMALDVRADGAPWLAEPPHTLLASVVDKPLLWFRPFGSPLGDASAFHLAATSMRPRQLALRLWAIFRGRCRHPRLRVDRCTDLALTGATGYLIDGDLYPVAARLDVRVQLGPRLRFLIPPAHG
jgi:hypothetical protein